MRVSRWMAYNPSHEMIGNFRYHFRSYHSEVKFIPGATMIKSPTPKRHRRPKSMAPLKDFPPRQCFIKDLPLELLIEILLYMPSPKCVLALARCSKDFCDTLVRNESMYIWKTVRATAKPVAIPDPTPNFTEPAYAAFIFDGGKCEVSPGATCPAYIFSQNWHASVGRYANSIQLTCTPHLRFASAYVAKYI